MESTTENGVIVKDYRLPEMQHQPKETTTDIVLMAMQKGYDPVFIEKMMDLAERNQKNIARQAYFEALALAKAEFPPLKKDKFNKFFDSWYTSLGMLLDTYNPILGKHGLSISFPMSRESLKDGKMTVTARLTHALGHSEDLTIPFPIDIGATGRQSGQKSRNDIQDIKSTFTYGRSVTAEAILGVAGTEASIDDDGNGAGKQPEYITEEQRYKIETGLKEKNIPTDTFFELLSREAKTTIVNVNTIPINAFSKAITLINKAKGTPRAEAQKIPCPRGEDVFETACDSCDERRTCPTWQ